MRLLTDIAKRARKRENALYLVYKIVKRLSHNWRALNGGPRLMQMVAAGALQGRHPRGIGSETGGDERLIEPITGRQFPHLLTKARKVLLERDTVIIEGGQQLADPEYGVAGHSFAVAGVSPFEAGWRKTPSRRTRENPR